jgi:hypothetical protein
LPHRINGGDAEHEAHGGIGRRAAALTQNVFGAGKTNDGFDREEVGRIFQPKLI